MEAYFSAVFTKGVHFCDFIFASLEEEILSKGGPLLKERICSYESEILSFNNINPIVKEGKNQTGRAASQEYVPCVKIGILRSAFKLQIRRGIEDKSKINFLISQWKHMLWPLIRTVSSRRF